MAIIKAKIPASNLVGNVPVSNLASLKSYNIGNAYIKSKSSSINCTVTQSGDLRDTDSGCSINMGIPNSATSTYVIYADGQYHLDWYETGDSGNYTGLGIQRRINGGTWTTIYRQGDWAHGANNSMDFNNRAHLTLRDHPSTAQQVEYRITIATHRNGASWARMPNNMFGYNMNLMVVEYDTGESS